MVVHLTVCYSTIKKWLSFLCLLLWSHLYSVCSWAIGSNGKYEYVVLSLENACSVHVYRAMHTGTCKSVWADRQVQSTWWKSTEVFSHGKHNIFNFAVYGRICSYLESFVFKTVFPFPRKIIHFALGGGILINNYGFKNKEELFSIPQNKRGAKQLTAISMFESTFQAKYFW